MTKEQEILEQAFQDHKPVATVLLLSGGHDSLTATHRSAYILEQMGKEFTVCHIDTGIGIPETQQYVKDVCARYGWPLEVYSAAENTRADGTPDPQIYDEIVKANGFPGPAAHRFMYSKLKQRQVRRIVRDRKKERMDRVLLVSGVRRQESARRMGTVQEVQRDGAQVWVAPMIDWSASDQQQYMKKHDLPRNPVKDRLCMSGECLCGAFAHKGEMDEIAYWYPHVAERLRKLEQEVRAAGHSKGWEGGDFEAEPDIPVGMNLCVACENRDGGGQ